MTPLRVAAVGDIMCGESFYQYRRGPRTFVAEMGPAFLPEQVAALLRSHDIVIGNVEAVLSDVGYRPGSLRAHQLRANPDVAPLLREWGLTVATVANNHILEHGRAAAIDTVRNLQAAGIGVAGAGPAGRFGRGVHAHVVQHGGSSVGILAACLLDERYAFDGGTPADDLIDVTRQAASDHSTVILALHWGTEYMSQPTRAQRELARRLIDAGATAILGHHPHVAQGVAQLEGGLVAYSLGNFIFDQFPEATRWSYILSMEIIGGRVHAWECHPFVLDDHHRPGFPPAGRRAALHEELRHLHDQATTTGLADEEYMRQAQNAELDSRRHRLRAVLHGLRSFPLAYSAQILLRPVLRRLRRW
jgi:poly-gamma-glutamate synthesis protein (capsule biosynthesis protein)